MGPDGDGDPVVIDGDLAPGQADDVFDLLGQHQDEDGGEAVSGAELLAVDDPCQGAGLLGV